MEMCSSDWPLDGSRLFTVWKQNSLETENHHQIILLYRVYTVVWLNIIYSGTKMFKHIVWKSVSV